MTPFKLKSPREVYLKAMAEHFGELSDVITYFDQFLVTGETEDNVLRTHSRTKKWNLENKTTKKGEFFHQ